MERKIKTVYALIACFILFVMTMGATYAYWAASVSSISNDINTSSTIYSINMDLNPLYAGTTFIPMDDFDAIKGIQNQCVDKYHRGACSAYTMRVYGYHESLTHISGNIEFITDDMQHLSFLILEEKLLEEYDETRCVIVQEKNYCIAKEATSMVSGEAVSFDAYDVSNTTEKNLILLVWLSNLNENQNNMDVGSFTATVTVLAGNGGEIKGTISGVVVPDTTDDSQGSDSQNNP